MPKESAENLVPKALRVALRPLAGFALRHSLKLIDFLEVVKAAYLDAAEKELRRCGKEVNVSRLSVMTGVHRRDATRLFRDKGDLQRQGDLVTKVIGQWRHSSRFSSGTGRPKALGYEGVESDFFKLVQSVSSDVAPYTVLHELERAGLVEKTARGLVLTQSSFVAPKGDLDAGFKMIGEDVHDLLSAAEENLEGKNAIKNLHLKTEYDNIPAADESEVRTWLLEEGSRFHERIESYLAKRDRDSNSKVSNRGGRIRVSFGSFSYLEPLKRES